MRSTLLSLGAVLLLASTGCGGGSSKSTANVTVQPGESIQDAVDAGTLHGRPLR